jgi:phosphonate transport system permease protein
MGRSGGLVAAACRLLLLVIRAVSPPVWALVLLFVFLPGPLPGALALGVYNAGILGRLFAEVVENLDRRPAAALRSSGAGTAVTFLYGLVPVAAGRFAAYSMYRWEIAIRESVVVGVVGAGGLGRLLEEQRAAFDYRGMLCVVLALLVLSLVVDFVSAAARRHWR